jgi:hypothetical protein
MIITKLNNLVFILINHVHKANIVKFFNQLEIRLCIVPDGLGYDKWRIIRCAHEIASLSCVVLNCQPAQPVPIYREMYVRSTKLQIMFSNPLFVIALCGVIPYILNFV